MEETKSLNIEGFNQYKIDKKGNLYNDKNYKMSIEITDSGLYYKLKANIIPYPRGTFNIFYLIADTFIPNEENKEYVHYDGNLANIDINKIKWIDIPKGKRPMKKKHKFNLEKEFEIVKPLEPKEPKIELTAEEKREKKRIDMKKYRYKKRYGKELVL
jgi:hypothetical protein